MCLLGASGELSKHAHAQHEGKLRNAETRDRTGDLQIFGLTLSQLSYRGLTIVISCQVHSKPISNAKQIHEYAANVLE